MTSVYICFPFYQPLFNESLCPPNSLNKTEQKLTLSLARCMPENEMKMAISHGAFCLGCKMHHGVCGWMSFLAEDLHCSVCEVSSLSLRLLIVLLGTPSG